MTDATAFEATGDRTGEARFGDYVLLLKPRVMSLVVFTALVGLLVAPGPVHPFLGFAAILFIALGAGASGALNMWYDADIDRVMRRTARRPVPAGLVEPGEALAVGVALSGIAVVMLGLAANWVGGGGRPFRIFFYAGVSTLGRRRLPPKNIVTGGAAGAFPPVIGWAAATGGTSLEAWLMFALIFLWTPPHFWALALFMKEDYHRAGVPMLTVTHGRRATRAHILGYTVVLAAFALGAGFTGLGGPAYWTAALLLNAWFMIGAFRIWRRDEAAAEADGYAVEKRFFRFSLIYLFVHFGALLADAALRGAGWV